MQQHLNIKSWAFTIISILFLTNCKPRNNAQEIVDITPLTDIGKSDEFPSIPLSSFIDSISYIKLNIPASIPMGQISKMEAFEDLIVISDLKLAKSVFLFDEKGEFKAKISKGINNPTLPTTIEDVTIDKDKGEIYIYSGSDAKLFVYNKMGNFKKTISVPNGYFSRLKKRGNDFLFYRELNDYKDDDPVQNYRLCLVDSTGKYAKGWYKGVRNQFFQVPTSTAPFKTVMGTQDIIFESPSLDTLLKLDHQTNEIKPVLAFDFGKANATLKQNLFKLKTVNEYMDLIKKCSEVVDVPLVTKKFVIGAYSSEGLVYNFVKNLDKDIISCGNGFKNDIDGIKVGSELNEMQSYDGVIYSLVDIDYLIQERDVFKINRERDPTMSVKKMNLISLGGANPDLFVLAKLTIKR